MEKKFADPSKSGQPVWEPDNLQLFFTAHLNRIYCTRAHLAERLQEMVDIEDFIDLKPAIKDTLAETEEQINRMDGIYTLLKKQYSFESCTGLVSLLEEDFTAIHQQSRGDVVMRDMCILLYLQSIDELEKSAIDILQTAAREKNNEHIKRFIGDHLNRAGARRTLLELIRAKYIFN